MYVLLVVPGRLLRQKPFLVPEHRTIVSVREALAGGDTVERRLQIHRALQDIARYAVGHLHAVDEARLAGYPLCGYWAQSIANSTKSGDSNM